MKSVCASLVVVAVLIASLTMGCGSRAEVAKERVVARIDSILGSMDVKRKEIEQSVEALDDGLVGLRKAKIKAQVQADQLQRKADLLDHNIGSIDSTLTTLREHLDSDGPAVIAEREYTAAELDRMARRLLERRAEHIEQLEGLQAARDRLGKVASTLDGKQTEYEGKLAGIRNQLSVIDSNRIALKAMQDAAQAMDGGEASLAKNVAHLEEKVNELYADVESELVGEDSRWSETATREDLESVEAIMSAVREPQSTVREIDAVLADLSPRTAAN